MKLLTRVQVKRAKRVHPEWTEHELLTYIRDWADASGPFADTVTLEDVREAVASMRDFQPRQEGLL